MKLLGRFQVILCLTFIVLNASAQTDKEKILSILEQQVAAWNKGNIEAFMQGYWNNDSLKFIGSTGITYGYNQTIERYKKSYPNTSQMGTLNFNILSIEKLSDEYYFVIGKWAIKRASGDISGHFSLVLRKINGVWKIIADHSS